MARSRSLQPSPDGPRSSSLSLRVGVKTDPIESRYSFEWLFRILAEEGIRHVQLGTFLELYQLPDAYFRELRGLAADFGLEISSVFTSHRELGGFFRGEPAWEDVARRGFERLIEVGAILGSSRVGSNPGSIPRDRLGLKKEGIACYLRNVKGLLRKAHASGIEALTLEPMSCLAEPPTLPEEIREMAEALLAEHRAHPEDTATAGVCADVTHGYADRDGRVLHSHMELLEAALPYTLEVHLKNTDPAYQSTFGFTEEERPRGIVDLGAVRDLLLARAGLIPVRELVGYLEIPGPKLGRDSSDSRLESQLRESLRHARETFELEAARAPGPQGRSPAGEAPAVEAAAAQGSPSVIIAPSLMCADMGHVAEEIRRLEEGGCEWLHLDIMDAHFVPNMPLGLVLVEQVRKLTSLPLDAHLMVEDPDFFIERLAPMGVDFISVQVEAAVHLDRTLQLIRSVGAKAGAALNPATPLSVLDYVIEQLDFVLIMTVNPGYAGQKLVPSALRKIAEARDYLDRSGRAIAIQVDGNVSFENIPGMVAAGADILVAGTSSVYHKGGGRRENIARARERIAEGLIRRSLPVSKARRRKP